MLLGHCVFPLPHPCGGGLGWGGGRYEIYLAGVFEACSPPTLALPHKGGGDHKAFCTSVFLLIQRYCPLCCIYNYIAQGYRPRFWSASMAKLDLHPTVIRHRHSAV